MDKAAQRKEPGTPGGERAEAPTRVRPTQQGTVYLWTLGAFSLFLLGFRAHLAFLLGSLAFGCAVVAWFVARANLRGLAVQRTLPLRTRAGAVTPIAWSVQHRGGPTRVGLELEDRPAAGTKPVRFVVDVPAVRGATSVGCEAELTFARRGEIEFGRQPLKLTSRFPLGIFRAERLFELEGRLLVRPREGRVSADLLRLLRGRQQAQARRRLARGDELIYGIREYREGDDPRRVHWRSTARRGVVTVSEWRSEEGREVLIVLGRGGPPGGRAASTFERAVSASATIWRACVAERLHVTLELGTDARITSPGDGRGLERGLDALARVGAQGRRRPRAALRRLGTASARRTVLYVAAAAETNLEAELKAAAGRAGRGLVVSAQRAALARFVRGLA
ncbi:MAG: DUF58 domain-containing protein [Planctomycetota bacterium]|nr:DUF58 domain-containing protein [Planctomycetota bacterium]